MTALLLFLFGACAIASAIIATSWTRLAVERWREPVRRRWLYDRYFMVRASLAASAFALACLCGLRAIDVIRMHGISVTSALLVAVLMAVLLLSKIALVWTTTLDHRSPSWRLFLILATLWAAGIAGWMMF